MIISPFDQNTPEWKEARLGLPTASCFCKIFNTKLQPSESRNKYMETLAGEIISGESEDGFYSKTMKKGHEREGEARRLYEFQHGVNIEQVGLCFKDEKKLFGASPDGLVSGGVGGFENKNANSNVQVARLLRGWTASNHKAQVNGCLLVTGRKWWDIQSYSRGFKPIVIRVFRDDEYLRQMEIELILFSNELKRMVDKLAG